MTSVLTTALSNVRSFSAACRSLPIQSINANTRQLLLNISRFLRRVTIHFINRDGAKITVKARTGQNLLDVVVDNDVDIDGYGACEGTLSCSTCHLIFTEELFKSLPKPSDEELDMLDLAYGQTDMSRLGCQVILTKEMDGVTFVVPDGVSDARDA